MSFGFGVGDFIAVGEVLALHAVIKETEELFSQQGLSPQQETRLSACRQGAEDVLQDLDALLTKYESLGTKSQRTFDRLGYGMQDMNAVRLRLISNVSMLDAFNNASSNARLEAKLNQLISEVRAGKRESSIISVQTFENGAQDDRETWDALCRELEDIGISSAVIADKRQLIVKRFQEAIAAGQLEEDVPSDDNDSAVDVYESDSPELTGQAMTRVEANQIAPVDSEANQSSGPLPSDFQNDIDEILKKLHIVYKVDPSRGPVPSDSLDPLQIGTHKEARKPYHVKSSFLVVNISKALSEGDLTLATSKVAEILAIEKKHGHAGYSLAMAVFSDQQAATRLLLIQAGISNAALAFITAAEQGKAWATNLLCEVKVDVNTRFKTKSGTALHAAIEARHRAMVSLLLEKGADIEARTLAGETALIVAVRVQVIGTVRDLLPAGANVDAKTPEGRTAEQKRCDFLREEFGIFTSNDPILMLLRQHAAAKRAEALSQASSKPSFWQRLHRSQLGDS